MPRRRWRAGCSPRCRTRGRRRPSPAVRQRPSKRTRRRRGGRGGSCGKRSWAIPAAGGGGVNISAVETARQRGGGGGGKHTGGGGGAKGGRDTGAGWRKNGGSGAATDETEPLPARLRAGDQPALGELFTRPRDRLWRMLYVRLDRRLASRVGP